MGQDIPLFSMLESKLRYVDQRERLVSQNIANSDTPGYQPTDLQPFSFEDALRPRIGLAGLTQTSAAHLPGRPVSASAFKAEASPDSETRLDGNSVVLEEEASKMTEARIDFETAIDFYQQSNNLIAMAVRAPGKGG